MITDTNWLCCSKTINSQGGNIKVNKKNVNANKK